jgi:hypothetical protein
MRDVRMVQGREDFRFPPQTSQMLRMARHRRWQHLERDLSLQAGIDGTIHLAHAARADPGDDFVAADSRAGRQHQS